MRIGRKGIHLDGACEASVVVCTRNRSDVLGENVESLLAQQHPSFEIIYVDDGSTDGTAGLLAQWGAQRPDAIRLLRIDHSGPGPARNAGARIARGKYLLFIDDDATAPPDWIGQMLRLRSKHGSEALCGGIRPYSMESPAERYLHYRMMTSLGDAAREVKAAPTGNLLVDRAAFEAAGGFRAVFLPAAEDWDLGYRLRQGGGRIFYDPEAAVVHRYQPNLALVERTIQTMGAAGVYVCRLQGRNAAAYTVYSLLRFAASPIWLRHHYPQDLYRLALRMEWLFAWSRTRAYFRMLRDLPVFQPPGARDSSASE